MSSHLNDVVIQPIFSVGAAVERLPSLTPVPPPLLHRRGERLRTAFDCAQIPSLKGTASLPALTPIGINLEDQSPPTVREPVTVDLNKTWVETSVPPVHTPSTRPDFRVRASFERSLAYARSNRRRES